VAKKSFFRKGVGVQKKREKCRAIVSKTSGEDWGKNWSVQVFDKRKLLGELGKGLSLAIALRIGE